MDCFKHWAQPSDIVALSHSTFCNKELEPAAIGLLMPALYVAPTGGVSDQAREKPELEHFMRWAQPSDVIATQTAETTWHLEPAVLLALQHSDEPTVAGALPCLALALVDSEATTRMAMERSAVLLHSVI